MPLFPAPSYRYTFGPTDRGWLAWNYDIDTAGTTNTALPTGGRLELVKVRLPVAASVTNVLFYMGTAGSSLTSGQCFVALYTEAGVRVGVSADQAAAWATSGLKTAALASGPFACPAGNYYAGIFFNGTTGPSPIRNINQAYSNSGLSSLFLHATADTGLTTTMPATLGAQSAANINWWAALS